MDAVAPKKEKQGKFDKWEVESSFDTLMRAEDIKGNSALMKEIAKYAGKKRKVFEKVESLADLKAVRQKSMTKNLSIVDGEEEEA